MIIGTHTGFISDCFSDISSPSRLQLECELQLAEPWEDWERAGHYRTSSAHGMLCTVHCELFTVYCEVYWTSM